MHLFTDNLNKTKKFSSDDMCKICTIYLPTLNLLKAYWDLVI